jgi:hypothetical protein
VRTPSALAGRVVVDTVTDMMEPYAGMARVISRSFSRAAAVGLPDLTTARSPSCLSDRPPYS